MHPATTLLALVLAAPLAAQNWYVPDTNAAVGICNSIPFGDVIGSGGYQSKYQVKATRTDLGGLPGLITGLGFTPCIGGKSHFGQIQIVLDHHPAGAPLSTTFDANLTPNAVTVLSATDYTWNTTANTWNEIGLQNFFSYNGTDDVVIQIRCVNGTSPAGFHRDVRQRIVWVAVSGSPPATGTSSNGGIKFEVGMLMARVSSHGNSCLGSNGMPAHSTSGTPQLTQTIGWDVTNGVPNGFALVIVGFFFGPPFELSAFGMPNCFQYQNVVSILLGILNGTGAGSVPCSIPNDAGLLGVKFYSQYACFDIPVNAAGLTTTNYNRVLIGN